MSDSNQNKGIFGLILGIAMTGFLIFASLKQSRRSPEYGMLAYKKLSYDTSVFVQVNPSAVYYKPSDPKKLKKYTPFNIDKSILYFLHRASIGDTFIKVAGMDEFFLLKPDSIIIYRLGLSDTLEREVILRKKVN